MAGRDLRKTAPVLAIQLLLAAGVAVAGSEIPEMRPGLEALRSGRFEEAQAQFARISVTRPAAPEGPFLEAFHLWWTLLERPPAAEADRVRRAMEAKLAEAASRSSDLERTAGVPSDVERERALVMRGAALLLDAQSKAARGAHLAAASSARQGHKALSTALDLDPECSDAMFAMGAYNYYADHLPAFVKGFRFLLLIPGGNSKEGISQLETASARSEMFGTESLMLLAHIFSGNYEQDDRRALAYTEKATARHPRSPLLKLVWADHLYALGRLRESAAAAASALEILEHDPGYPDQYARLARYRRAACALKLHDPLGSLELIESSLRESPPVRSQEAGRWLSLLGAASREAGRPERLEAWIAKLGPSASFESAPRRPSALGADPVAAARAQALSTAISGDGVRAIRQIEELRQRHPDDLRLRYDLGRLLQQEGRLEEARPHLQAVAGRDSRLSSPDLAGWASLRLGWELERNGRRGQATQHYRRASKIKRFTFQAAARDLMAHPRADQPEG